MKAAQKIKSALALIGLLALGILTGALLFRKPENEKSDEAEKAKEEKKNEIESTPAGSLVSAAGNADKLRAEKDRNIEGEMKGMNNILKQIQGWFINNTPRS